MQDENIKKLFTNKYEILQYVKFNVYAQCIFLCKFGLFLDLFTTF